MSESNGRCGTCKFAVPVSEYSDAMSHLGVMVCLRFPPTADVLNRAPDCSSIADGVFPMVASEDHWCGEYKSKRRKP